MAEERSKNSSSSDELLQLVICQLSDEEFGIEISKVKEIIRIPEITKIPQAPYHIEGIINLRGSIIPVINLAARFNLSKEKMDDRARIMVIELDNIIAGMIVDAVTEVMRISIGDIDPAPDIIASNISEKYIQGVGKLDNRLLILLDIDRVFTEEQKMNVAQLENTGLIFA
ncbi:chemotaxis protein CheW [Methanomethylovorans sp.]|uniref:chemotaxis protein CheW n=1 Tax=Methanomethylovorans sp. TaxID=2758717 RepID=UPI00351C1E6A